MYVNKQGHTDGPERRKRNVKRNIDSVTLLPYSQQQTCIKINKNMIIFSFYYVIQICSCFIGSTVQVV